MHIYVQLVAENR